MYVGGRENAGRIGDPARSRASNGTYRTNTLHTGSPRSQKDRPPADH
jgi:hypothetical protein